MSEFQELQELPPPSGGEQDGREEKTVEEEAQPASQPNLKENG